MFSRRSKKNYKSHTLTLTLICLVFKELNQHWVSLDVEVDSFLWHSINWNEWFSKSQAKNKRRQQTKPFVPCHLLNLGFCPLYRLRFLVWCIPSAWCFVASWLSSHCSVLCVCECCTTGPCWVSHQRLLPPVTSSPGVQALVKKRRRWTSYWVWG